MSADLWFPLLPDTVPVHRGCPVVVCRATGALTREIAGPVSTRSVRVAGALVHLDRVQPDLDTADGFGVLLRYVSHYTVQLGNVDWPDGLLPMVRRWLTGGTTDGDRVALAHAATVVSGSEARWGGFRSGVMNLGERVTAEEARMLAQHDRCRGLFGLDFYERPPSERVALVRVHLSGRRA